MDQFGLAHVSLCVLHTSMPSKSNLSATSLILASTFSFLRHWNLKLIQLNQLDDVIATITKADEA